MSACLSQGGLWGFLGPWFQCSFPIIPLTIAAILICQTASLLAKMFFPLFISLDLKPWLFVAASPLLFSFLSLELILLLLIAFTSSWLFSFCFIKSVKKFNVFSLLLYYRNRLFVILLPHAFLVIPGHVQRAHPVGRRRALSVPKVWKIANNSWYTTFISEIEERGVPMKL